MTLFSFLYRPIVYAWFRTPPFQGGKPGSTPGGMTMPPLWRLFGLSVNTDFVSLNYHWLYDLLICGLRKTLYKEAK